MNRLALACLAALCGCVSISDIDVTKAEPACARQCTATYSACVAAPSVGANTALFYQCKQGLNACIQTCPPR